MTKKEAIALEALCEKWLSQIIGYGIEISMNLAGRLKISFDNGEKRFCINKDLETLGYITFTGEYYDLECYKEEILECIKEHKEDFKLLLWSYENIDKLEDN